MNRALILDAGDGRLLVPAAGHSAPAAAGSPPAPITAVSTYGTWKR
ncbi:MAG TPA: hypothetical protein VMV69_16125 [Pirellulales bacterium]|nr:hypothetical protein [Pirellulales bacterium]